MSLNQKRLTLLSVGPIVLFLLLFPGTAPADPPQGQPVRILFIGNSYTRYNRLPAIVQQIASAANERVETSAVAQDGATLELHWDRKEAMERLRSQKWDYVVLQEQSMRPIEDPETMRKYARLFLDEIEKAGARPILFLTWSRQKAPDSQAGLTRTYVGIASEFHAAVAPVGLAWHAALKEIPYLQLYTSDGSHPSPAGSYLAACVFFSMIWQRSPEGLPARLTDSENRPLVALSPPTASVLQRVAWRTVESFKGSN